MQKIKNFSVYFIFFYFALYLLTFSGCVTVPEVQRVTAYNLNGIQYLPLVSLCNSNGIKWSYDTYTRNIILVKGAHKINMRVGEDLILVDGAPQNLRHRVDFYRGEVVVPQRFQEQVLTNLFKAPLVSRERTWVISNLKKVVIDPGHGGNDPGAIGRSGLREKNINLDIARRLSKILRSQGIEVVMTRNYDTFVSLARRVDIANNAGADLFISIHSNANPAKSLNGFEVYYVADRISDYQRAVAAARQWPLNFGQCFFAGVSPELKVTVWDMVYANNRAESISLARSLCDSINRNLDTPVLGVKGAGYYVLKNVRMPAVLIEIGFLSNAREERRLTNSYYRQEITGGIAEGLSDYARGASLIMEIARQ